MHYNERRDGQRKEREGEIIKGVRRGMNKKLSALYSPYPWANWMEIIFFYPNVTEYCFIYIYIYIYGCVRVCARARAGYKDHRGVLVIV